MRCSTGSYLEVQDEPAVAVPDAAIPTLRRSFGGAVLGNKNCAVGGLADVAEVFDFESKTWSRIAARGLSLPSRSHSGDVSGHPRSGKVRHLWRGRNEDAALFSRSIIRHPSTESVSASAAWILEINRAIGRNELTHPHVCGTLRIRFFSADSLAWSALCHFDPACDAPSR